MKTCLAKDATLTLRLTARLLARLKREAVQQDCSTALIVREALREYFQEKDETRAEKLDRRGREIVDLLIPETEDQ
jgi:predicted transcriptional regulator